MLVWLYPDSSIYVVCAALANSANYYLLYSIEDVIAIYGIIKISVTWSEDLIYAHSLPPVWVLFHLPHM